MPHDPRIGGCPDTGHPMRSGLDPVEALVGLRTHRMAVGIAPNNRAAAWTLCRFVVFRCKARRVQQAKELIDEVRAKAPGTLADSVAIQLDALIGHIETMAYSAALEVRWQLRDYMYPGPLLEELDTLGMGIQWFRGRRDPAIQVKVRAFLDAAEIEAANPEPQRRAFGLLLQARAHQRQGKKARAAELYLKAADADQEVGSTGLVQAGYCLSNIDPDRAIAAFERFRAERTSDSGYVTVVPMSRLAGLYWKVGRYQEGLDLYRDIERQCETKDSLVDIRGNRLTAGIVASLEGLGRNDEAEALAGPILEREGFGTPVEQLPAGKVAVLYGLLKRMGRTDEAREFEQELIRRAKAKHPEWRQKGRTPLPAPCARGRNVRAQSGARRNEQGQTCLSKGVIDPSVGWGSASVSRARCSWSCRPSRCGAA